MPPTVDTYEKCPAELELILNRHLPYSLPLLRRIQFDEKKAVEPNSRVVFVSNTDSEAGTVAFTAAHVDLAGATLVVYSTLEDTGEVTDLCKHQVTALVGEVVRIVADHGGADKYPQGLVLGTLNTYIRNILLDMGNRITPRATGFYDKWLFMESEIPDISEDLPAGMSWSTATIEDCRLVVSRTHIPRTAEMISRLPSLIIRLDDGTPISWAFIGQDGSLISLHCEEPYRRRGFAKAVAAKLLRQGLKQIAADGWCAADVTADNIGSRRMCQSLGGKPHWQVSWVEFDITEKGHQGNANVKGGC